MIITKKNIFIFLVVFLITTLTSFLFFYFQSDKENYLVNVDDKDVLNEKLNNFISLPESPDIINLSPSISLVFGGDIMLSRTVNSKMSKYNNFSWPLINISNFLSEADLSITNLESPFLYDSNYNVPSGSFSFKADPKSLSALIVSGIDILSLANNHILNQGIKGINDTKDILNKAEIDYIGLSDKPFIVKEVKGIKFAFLAYSYSGDSVLVNSLNLNKAKDDIIEARKNADVIIVIMHAGTEYVREANWQQKEFAHYMIDNGADLIVGHHPHWMQKVEEYEGKKIIYSLGNLVFDQMWSQDTREGLLAKVNFNGKEIKDIEYFPIIINDYGQANFMSDKIRIKELLQEIGVN